MGIGTSKRIIAITIIWPSGENQRFEEIELNKFYSITEGDPQLRVLNIKKIMFDN